MTSHDEELCAALTRMALAGDGVVLGLGMAVLAVRTWCKFRKHSKALKQVQETSVTSIADLRSLAQEQAEAASAEASKVYPAPKRGGFFSTGPSDRGKVREPSLVIVRGKVHTKASVEPQGKAEDADALVAQNVGDKAVFVERTQTYVHTEMYTLLGWITQRDLVTFTQNMCLYNEWRGIFGWSEWTNLLGWGPFKEQVTISRRKVPFVLVEQGLHLSAEGRSSKMPLFVHVDLNESRHSLPLVTVYHQLHPVPASSYTFLQAMFGRRYPVGLLDEEKILPVGKEITAVGFLALSPDGSPVIKSCKRLPCFLTEYTRDQLVTELASGSRVLLWTGIVVTTIAAGVLGYALIKNFVKWKARRQMRQRQDEESRQERLLVEEEHEDIADVPDGQLCVVCLLRRRRAAFIQCGHRVCCGTCAQRVEQGANPRCPVCRQNVIGTIRVYDG